MKTIKSEDIRIGMTIRGCHGQPGVVIGVEAPGNELNPNKWVAWVNVDLPGGAGATTRIWGWEPGELVEIYSVSQEVAA
jgi:hypothetical protein